jgi:hypothetical protein
MGGTGRRRITRLRAAVLAVVALAVVLPIDRARVPTARAAIGCSLSLGITPEIVADSMEITQSIQDGGNALTIVAGKRTYVRLYSHLFAPFRLPRDRAPTRRTSANLKGFPTGSCISDATLMVSNGGRTATLEPLEAEGLDTVGFKRVDRFLRGDPAFGFLFELPTFATSGTTSLRAEVNPNGTITEANRANNVLQGPVSFTEVPRMSISFERVSYSVGNTTFNTPLGDLAQMARWIQRAYPVPGVDWRSRAVNVGAHNVDSNNEFTDLTCDDLNLTRFIDEIGFFNFSKFIELQASNRRFYSMIDDAGGFMRGCALLDEPPFGPIASGPTGTPAGVWSWDTDGIYGDWYGAHEIGHTFDRKHVLCDGSEGGPGPWPYPNGLISAQGSNLDAAVGFDVETRETYPFDVGHDIMTYCPEQWVSDVSYKLFGLHALLGGPTGDEPSFEGGDDICVAGTLGVGKASPEQTRFYPTFGGDASSTQIGGKKKKTKGKFAIELRGASGELIDRQKFTPLTSRPGAAYLGIRERTKKTLNVLRCLPFDPRVTDVIVTAGRKPLGTIEAGTSAPIVEVLPVGTTEPSASPSPSPTPTPTPTPTPPVILAADVVPNGAPPVEPLTPSTATVPLSWVASDPDGDQLTHLVQASTDGGRTWRTVAEPTTATSIDIPRENLHSGENHFRVLTTDGIRVSSDVLDNGVLIATDQPLLEIRSPSVSEHIRSRQTLNLEAFAYDLDTGSLDGNIVRWSSDRDGSLGIGDQISVTGLSPGGHIITVTATGSGGSTSRSVPIVVD